MISDHQSQQMPRWILASASPRRQELLRLLLPEFGAAPSLVDESAKPAETPPALVRRLAAEKAKAVQPLYPEAAILSADTIVVCNGEMLGKPFSPEHARRMLRKLSGQNHQVLTGVCLLHGELQHVEVCSTHVLFSVLSENEIEWYVKSGEPLDKAGAYAIQGTGARFIEKIDGCYFNVMGLPVSLVYRLLKKLGYELYG
jgi:septum formation protein